ncbi:1-deoxy-D-xylulose-5-phosphate synthase [Salinibius halmophilus]|uniref:1-deoxy-D-xylulose-5-phosphate synthase n=1 Tax=Salinibius halmophilus TaxID=1853216 RepID=UPI000E6685A9|nr:1-deoxy-D-xylulose-5-phosphate synthase [Salinibius halmophilus]
MKVFEQLPTERPVTPLLDGCNTPRAVRSLPEADLRQLADELREYLLWSVGSSGGHFGAGLGVIELTIALHYRYNTPDVPLVWDVGHQAYPHKILTERREQLPSIRHFGGLAAFPDRQESQYDAFGTGHSSTSISAALGMAIANKLQGKTLPSLAVIGDGALTAGMAFEALNHAGHEQSNITVILNDNDMSISHNVGQLQKTFSAISKDSSNAEMHPRALFRQLGFLYRGPIDGHDLPTLLATLKEAQAYQGPQVIHVLTTKGRGYLPAERQPIQYHAITKLPHKYEVSYGETFSQVFGNWLCKKANEDQRLTAITPAMCIGSGMQTFSEQYPQRFFDVGIAEQHAVTLAAGMACQGSKPVVAIYSTFLQRAYDQLIHDVAIQKLPVMFAIDRAGFVGGDGATHAGSFDISYLRCIPNLTIITPSNKAALTHALEFGWQQDSPVCVRYPKGDAPAPITEESAWQLGKAQWIRQGENLAVLVFGVIDEKIVAAAEAHNWSLVDMRFVKPLDEAMLARLIDHPYWVTIEEGSCKGGAGSAILEWIHQQALSQKCLLLGINDRFVSQGSASDVKASMELDGDSMVARIKSWVAK